jgi:hypothetical protein
VVVLVGVDRRAIEVGAHNDGGDVVVGGHGSIGGPGARSAGQRRVIACGGQTWGGRSGGVAAVRVSRLRKLSGDVLEYDGRAGWIRQELSLAQADRLRCGARWRLMLCGTAGGDEWVWVRVCVRCGRGG